METKTSFISLGGIRILASSLLETLSTSFSIKAIQRIVGLIYEEKRHPSGILDDLISNETLDHQNINKLDYYGKILPTSTQPIQEHIKRNNKSLNNDEKQFGKIANPTVHAALNQIKIVVNEIIEEYGKPENLHIEFARDMKQSKQEKTDQSKKQKQNEGRNDKAKEFILEHKQKITAFNLERTKLWFELSAMKNQNCIYSGKIISAKSILSDELQIDHILPFSRTLDDGFNNKVLVFASENQKKKNKTPFEAFSKDEKKWAEIQERVAYLPENKKWRFFESAIKQFEKDNGFLSRHLNDTRYISKIAKKYLSSIADENKIVVSRGQMTALIRGKLGMYKLIQNPDGTKNRDDHRHHAIDALAVALTSRSYLKQVADESAAGEKSSKIQVPQPWEGFTASVEKAFNEIKVSHKIDHDSNGPFMEETCFGIIKNLNDYENKNDFKLVTRKAIENIKPNNFDTIRDPKIRELVLKKGIAALPKEIKTLRVYESSKEKNEDIGSGPESGLAKINHGPKGENQKIYQKGDINYLSIWSLSQNLTLNSDGNKLRKSPYVFKAVKTFDLNAQDTNTLKPHPAAKLITKIYKGDTVALEIKSEVKYFLLKSIKAANKQLEFLEIKKSKVADGEKQFLLSFSKLTEYKFRKIHISPIGLIKDHGPILK